MTRGHVGDIVHDEGLQAAMEALRDAFMAAADAAGVEPHALAFVLAVRNGGGADFKAVTTGADDDQTLRAMAAAIGAEEVFVQ